MRPCRSFPPSCRSCMTHSHHEYHPAYRTRVGTPLGVVRMRHNTPLDNSRYEDYIYAGDNITTADGDPTDEAVRELRGGDVLKPPAHGRGAHARPRGRPETCGTLAEPI